MIGVSVGTEVLFFKDSLPLSRILESWEDRGLSLSAGTIVSGPERIAPFFEPLYEALVARSRTASFSQADETRYYVFNPDRTRQWAWVILTPDTALYILDSSRSAKVPLNHFSGRSGILLVDRYGAYKATARQVEGLELAFWSGEWVRRIGLLFHETRLLRDEHPAARTAVLSLLEEMRSTAQAELRSRTLPPAATKVLKRLGEHWDGLTLFVDDPRIPKGNNASERALRGLVVGRKIFYGAGALWSGTLAMILSSLFRTWEIGGLGLRTTLADYLETCARRGQAPSDVSPWLPWELPPERKRLLSRPFLRDPA